MNPTRRTSPIPRFLGPDADGGPLELLALTLSECTPARIEAALETQLNRIDRHAESSTPEADEVRLALHTAAAQLLDPAVRRMLMDSTIAAVELPVEIELPPPLTEPTRASAREHAAAPCPVIQEHATTTQAAPIGYPSIPIYIPETSDPNRSARNLIIGLSVAGALCVLGATIGLILLSSSSRPAATTPTTTASSPTTPTTTAAKSPSSESPQPAADAAPAGSANTEAAAATPAKPGHSEFTDPALVVRLLRDSTTKAKADPLAGLGAFKAALPALADWWCRFDIAQRRAADDAVVEFLYATASQPDISRAAVDELARRASMGEGGLISPGAVWPGAWAAGVLTRLSNERDLPRALAANVNAALNDALGAGRAAGTLSFESGANAALRRMPGRLIPGVSSPTPAENSAADPGANAIKQWIDAVAAVNSDPLEAERVLADGLEQILLVGPEPDSNLSAYEAIELLVTRIKWRNDGPARERLLQWFLDTAVSEADLRVLTGVLANKSGAEGVDATMVLSQGASPDDRAKLRAHYAGVWGIVQSEARDKAMRNWRNQSEIALNTPVPTESFARLIAVVGASRFNLAARRLWLGDAAGATKIVDDTYVLLATLPNTAQGPGPSSPIPLAPGSPPGQGSPGSPPTPKAPGKNPRTPIAAPPSGKQAIEPFSLSGVDGHWAEAYLKAERNIPVRLDRLAALDGMSNPIGRTDAAVLAEAACFASPAQVRYAAQHAVQRFGDDANMIEGMLNQLPSAPRIVSVAQAFERVAGMRLPKVGDPDWELLTRRALVERLLSALAAQGEQAGIELAAAQIAEAYARMSGVDTGPVDEPASDRALRGVTSLFRLWRIDAERLPTPAGIGLTLDQIDRRRESRQRIASGPAQQFVAEQAAVADVFAYIVCSERQSQSGKIATILGQLNDTRRHADHIFTQMLANEQAILRLWMVRYGEGGI